MLAGPVVAGAVINALSWRWIFFLAVPLLLLTSILSAVLLPFAAAFAVPLYFQTVDGMPPGQAGWLSPHRGRACSSRCSWPEGSTTAPI
ncbi:hypothetical protein OHB01_36775 [Microbispora hainanensis]|uniref:Major facilitator superfamily (MFS) profile domain-containing protein n=1 Tax=Microbispora hainanensis TaxID=568844 RepID=A0ABZ1T020_9ACTN|nr:MULTISPECIES: MFS transporter [Microbispora]